MKVPFVKMHGTGNDFILIDGTKQDASFLNQQDIVKKLSMRRFGIGADQILLLCDSDIGDYQMRIFNADGDEVEMCGNGIRCLAKYINDNNPSEKEFSIETLAGIIKPKVKEGGLVEVDMGIPILEGKDIPVKIDGKIIDLPLTVDDKNLNITCVSMGNPHCVTFCDNVEEFQIEKYGPLIENHELFPQRINVEFIEVVDKNNIKMKVWERGSGITLACGTGACASAVASILNDKTEKQVKVMLEGGNLDIRWEEDNHVYMTGPAETVFSGEIEIPLTI